LATATTAYLNLPQSMAIDASGNLYIADAGDNRIRFVNMTGKPYTINGIVVAAGDIVTVAGTTGDITDALTRKRVAATAGWRLRLP